MSRTISFSVDIDKTKRSLTHIHHHHIFLLCNSKLIAIKVNNSRLIDSLANMSSSIFVVRSQST